MGSTDDADVAGHRELLATLIRSPSETRSLLPVAVGLLDDEDREVRLSASTAICIIGVTDVDVVPYLVRRLVDRLDDDSRAEAVLAFEYLASQYPAVVDESIQEIREESDTEPLSYTRPGGFRRSDVHSRTRRRRGVGRTRIAGDGVASGPDTILPQEEDEARPDLAVRKREESDDEAGPAAAGGGSDPAESRLEFPPELLEHVLTGSVFSDIAIRSGGVEGRFADRYRLLATVRGQEQAVGLRVFHRPSSGRVAFTDQLLSSLSAWRELDDEHILRLYDYGREPRPWAATAFAEETLGDRGRLPPTEAAWNAVRITRAVSQLHVNSVVHGGLDPGAIAYSGDVLDDGDRQAPLVDNIGLLEAFRYPFDPGQCLDPRYAAPEYFDQAYGTIDHATDVYHLGALCYRLFTGEAPFDVDENIRQHVLHQSPPHPSEQFSSVPALVDTIVRKAMARQKLTRYETVTQMEQDLLRVSERLGNDD